MAHCPSWSLIGEKGEPQPAQNMARLMYIPNARRVRHKWLQNQRKELPLKHIAKRSCLPLPTLALPTQRVNRRPRVNRRHSEDRRCEWILKGTANPEGKPQAWQEPRRASREPPHGDPSAPARLSCAPDLVPSLGWVTWFMSRKLAANAMKSWRSFWVSGSGSNPSGSGKALQSRPGTS